MWKWKEFFVEGRDSVYLLPISFHHFFLCQTANVKRRVFTREINAPPKYH